MVGTLRLVRLRHNRLYPLIPRARRLRRVSKDEAGTRHLGLQSDASHRQGFETPRKSAAPRHEGPVL